MKHIPLAKPYFTEEEIDEVRDTLQSGWVAQGPRVKKLEDIISQHSDAKYGVAVNSCTSALHLSLLAHGLGHGDKIIVPDFTYTATGNVTLHIGAVPVLVDIDPITLCIDPTKIEEKIDKEVKAIIPVHAFGYPAEIQKINQIAEDHNLIVIEDAALALGSEINNKKIGSFQNTTCFSLQARKLITTGEGGMILSSSEEITEKLRAMRSQGAMSQQSSEHDLPVFQMLGLSYRLSDIQAAIGIVQMKRINDLINKRTHLAQHYNDLFVDSGLNIQTPKISKDIHQNFQTYVVILNQGKRNQIITQLREKQIESTIGTYALSHQPLFKTKEHFPISDYAFKNSLALPMYHELTADDVDYIVNSIKKIITSCV